jgi:hypothetical protein
MRVQNVLRVLAVALATMTFTLMAIGPWNTGVSKEAKSITPRIAQPTFASHGCQFTLKTAKTAYEPGQSPVVHLTAVNPTGKDATATVWVSLMTAEVTSPLARAMPIPRTAWSKPWCVSLKPGETKTTSLTADVKLGAKQNVTITIGDKEQAIMVKELPVRRGEPLKKAAAK